MSRWTREVAKSGPGDTLDGRWRVRRELSGAWCVIDLAERTILTAGFRTMRDARTDAELWARAAQEKALADHMLAHALIAGMGGARHPEFADDHDAHLAAHARFLGYGRG